MTGIVVGAVGIDALRHVRNRHQIPLAATPLLLAVHQVDESLVWLGLRGQVSFSIEHAAIYVFLAVAFVLPFWVPFAMLGVETKVHRRELMKAFLAIGLVTSAALLIAIVAGPVGASIDGSHIAYDADINYAGILVALYIVATCGSCLVASNRWLVLLGLRQSACSDRTRMDHLYRICITLVCVGGADVRRDRDLSASLRSNQRRGRRGLRLIKLC